MELNNLVGMSDVRTKLLAVLKKVQTGKYETAGPNRGPVVDLINKTVGAPLGSPWCATTVSFYCQKLKLPVATSFSAAGLLSANRHRIVEFSAVRPGDIFVIERTINGRTSHHAGFVIQKINFDQFRTLEGNASVDGSFNGDGIYSRTRNVSRGKYSFISIH